MNEMEKLGELVKVRSAELQEGISPLVGRGLADVTAHEFDPRLAELISILKNSADWNERVNAWQEISEMGPATKGWVELLRDVIYTGDGWARIFAAETLSWLGLCVEDAVPVLAAALQTTLELKRYDWARMACAALGKYAPLPRPLAALSMQSLLLALDAGDLDVQAYAAGALGARGSAAEAALVKIAGLFDQAEGPLREHFLQVMQKIAPAVNSYLDALSIALANDEEAIRISALTSAIAQGRKVAPLVPDILILCRDENPIIRKLTAMVLAVAEIRTSEVLDRLDMIAGDDDPEVQLAAAYASVKLANKPERNLSVIVESLQSGFEQLRAFGAWALGEVGGIGSRRAVAALKKALLIEQNDSVGSLIRTALVRLEEE